MPSLSSAQLDLLSRMTSESGRRDTVQVAGVFAWSETGAPPLKELLGMGSVALKLYRTLVMATRQPLHELFRGTSAARLARMLGFDDSTFDDASSSGTRRVQRAIRQLDAKGFIERTPRKGQVDLIKVRHFADGADLSSSSVRLMSTQRGERYVTLPLNLWRNGWINLISVRGLAVYVALRRHCAGKEDQPIHVSPHERSRGYQLSEDTWAGGLRDLEALGLVTRERGNPDDRNLPSRERWLYTLHSELMATEPPPF